MRISDWSSDVCSSDLGCTRWRRCMKMSLKLPMFGMNMEEGTIARWHVQLGADFALGDILYRSEEHTSELQSLMRISYAVFCLKKKKRLRYVRLLYTSEENNNNIQSNIHITQYLIINKKK